MTDVSSKLLSDMLILIILVDQCQINKASLKFTMKMYFKIQ